MSTAVAPEAIRARQRPLAILGVYLTELAFALLIATPVHAWARRAWGEHPDGDALLWLPGGRDLLIWIGQNDAAISVVSRTSLVLLVVSAVMMQLPLGALVASLAFARASDHARGPTWRSALRVGVGAFTPLAGLLTLGSIVELLVVIVGYAAASAANHGLAERLGEARSFLIRLPVFALFLALAAIVGVVVDLARVAVAREIGLERWSSGAHGAETEARPGWTTLVRGLGTALAVSRRRLRTAVVAWTWRAAVGVLLVLGGIAAAQALGGKGGGSLIALWSAHQLVVLARVALRASWLAQALRLVAPVQDERHPGESTP